MDSEGLMPATSPPKYLDIAQAVESQLLGRERAKVPSAREIAGEYGVSVVTASRAIQVLRDKGLIQTVGRSGSFMTPRTSATAGKEYYALVLRSTPGPWCQTSMAFSQAGFATLERQEGVRFEIDRFVFDDGTRLANLQRQARRAAEAGVLGIVFMPSRYRAEAARQDELFLRSCRDAGLAVVLIERNLRGLGRALEYDLVAADDFDGGLRCTEHLLNQGRRRIVFVTGSPTSSHESRLAGYLTSLYQAHSPCSPSLLEQPPGVASKDSYGELADQIIAQRADAVVCYQDYTALGLILELLNRGIRVPSDIAITGFDNLPIGKSYSIGVTTYAFSPEAIARQATRLLRSRLLDRFGPPVKVLIPGELIVRESSAVI
jgi:LacI family transcriptional regulator